MLEKEDADMTQISISELKANAGKYVAMVDSQDVFITKNGKLIARLTAAKPNKTAAARSLFGLIRENVDLEAEREERLR